MKSVFRCEYCDFMGTEDEVLSHEPDCPNNYTRRSCSTCKHKGYVNLKQYKCACGKEIPEGLEMRFCDKYDRKEKSDTFSDLLSGILGGL